MTIRSLFILAASGMSLLFATGCTVSSSPAPIENSVLVDPAGPVKKVEVEVGKTVVVQLESNATTGYHWEVAPGSLGSVLSLVQKPIYVTDPAPVGMVGTGGTTKFMLSGEKPGIQRVRFLYLAPGTSKVGREATVIVVVSKP